MMAMRIEFGSEFGVVDRRKDSSEDVSDGGRERGAEAAAATAARGAAGCIAGVHASTKLRGHSGVWLLFGVLAAVAVVIPCDAGETESRRLGLNGGAERKAQQSGRGCAWLDGIERGLSIRGRGMQGPGVLFARVAR